MSTGAESIELKLAMILIVQDIHESNTTITNAMIRAKAREISSEAPNPRRQVQSYADNDSKDDGPCLHELIEQGERERVTKEADAELTAQNSGETDKRIPTVYL